MLENWAIELIQIEMQRENRVKKKNQQSIHKLRHNIKWYGTCLVGTRGEKEARTEEIFEEIFEEIIASKFLKLVRHQITDPRHPQPPKGREDQGEYQHCKQTRQIILKLQNHSIK